VFFDIKSAFTYKADFEKSNLLLFLQQGFKKKKKPEEKKKCCDIFKNCRKDPNQ